MVTAVALAVVSLAIDVYSSQYLMGLMKEYDIAPAQSHHRFTQMLYRVALAAGLGGVVLSAVLSVFSARGIIRPLQQIGEMMARLTEGHAVPQLPVIGPREARRLSGAFNLLVRQLKEREELQKSLVADVAHELRTPLNNMRGYLEALRDGVMPPSRELFDSLHDEALLLSGVVDNLFTLAESNASIHHLQFERIDLRALVSQAAATCQPRIDAKGLTLELRIATDAQSVIADPRIRQAARNLLENAVEHTPDHSRILVTTQAMGVRVRLSVIDQGHGIDERDLPFIFDRFFRGKRQPPGGVRGAGLGLAIVKVLVVANGGSVGAESTPTGAHVWFDLPSADR
ncbi:MAG: HAMP domain-containing histidine kinase [Bryobacteraceae bacterium]|nr:HAMP domain-containing histidine kinase [Bryobacteraceae bacterium]